MVVILYCAIVYFLPRINPFVPTIPNLNHDLDVTYDYGYLRGIAGFMMGMLTYVAYSKEKIVHLFTGDTIALVTILVLLVSMHFGWNDLVYIPLFVLLVLCFSSNEGKLALLCAQKPLQYLGDISYSIYMVHGLMLFFAGDFYLKLVGITFKEGEMRQIPFLSGLWSSLLFLGLVIGISSITYYGIEKPCRKWLNRKMN
jgi:peptidoglycan/LPS O-acetylase OafA/YrhL